MLHLLEMSPCGCLLPFNLNLLCFSVHSGKTVFVQCYTVLKDLHPRTEDDLYHATKCLSYCHTFLIANCHFPWKNW